MAHPLKVYARHVQSALGHKVRSYQWCLRFVQAHWAEVEGLPKQERREKLASEAIRIKDLADQAMQQPDH